MSRRDPRIDPRPGDLIVQRPSMTRLRVLERDGDQVKWAREKHRDRHDEHNTWSVRGWRDVVAAGSAVLEVSQP